MYLMTEEPTLINEANVKTSNQFRPKKFKVECVFRMIIWSEFRMVQYRDDDHREDAPHFSWSNFDALDVSLHTFDKIESDDD